MSKWFLFLAPAVLAAVVLSACGGSGDESNAVGNEADAAFVADMIPHHEGAVMMAVLAQDRAEHPELKALANEIIAAQEKEISEMQALEGDLPEAGTDDSGSMSMGEDHMGHAGMDAEAMGMDMDPSALKNADSFDLAFIDMMIPHHEGAVEMAQKLLEDGENPQLQAMARAVISSQNAEIETMENWRQEWSGQQTAPKAGTQG